MARVHKGKKTTKLDTNNGNLITQCNVINEEQTTATTDAPANKEITRFEVGQTYMVYSNGDFSRITITRRTAFNVWNKNNKRYKVYTSDLDNCEYISLARSLIINATDTPEKAEKAYKKATQAEKECSQQQKQRRENINEYESIKKTGTRSELENFLRQVDEYDKTFIGCMWEFHEKLGSGLMDNSNFEEKLTDILNAVFPNEQIQQTTQEPEIVRASDTGDFTPSQVVAPELPPDAPVAAANPESKQETTNETAELALKIINEFTNNMPASFNGTEYYAFINNHMTSKELGKLCDQFLIPWKAKDKKATLAFRLTDAICHYVHSLKIVQAPWGFQNQVICDVCSMYNKHDASIEHFKEMVNGLTEESIQTVYKRLRIRFTPSPNPAESTTKAELINNLVDKYAKISNWAHINAALYDAKTTRQEFIDLLNESTNAGLTYALNPIKKYTRERAIKIHLDSFDKLRTSPECKAWRDETHYEPTKVNEQETENTPAPVEDNKPAETPKINPEKSADIEEKKTDKPASSSRKSEKKSLLTVEAINACETREEIYDILITAKKKELIEFVKLFGIYVEAYKGLKTLQKMAKYCAAKILIIREHEQRQKQQTQKAPTYISIAPVVYVDKHQQICIDFEATNRRTIKTILQGKLVNPK